MTIKGVEASDQGLTISFVMEFIEKSNPWVMERGVPIGVTWWDVDNRVVYHEFVRKIIPEEFAEEEVLFWEDKVRVEKRAGARYVSIEFGASGLETGKTEVPSAAD